MSTSAGVLGQYPPHRALEERWAKCRARLPGNAGRREDSVGTVNERSRRSSCRRPKLPSSEEMSEPGVRHVWLASSHCCMFNFLSGGFVPFAKMFMWDWGRGAKGAPCRYVRPCTHTQPAFEVPRGQRHFSQRLLGLKRGPPEPRRSSLAEGAPSDSPREPSPRCGGPPSAPFPPAPAFWGALLRCRPPPPSFKPAVSPRRPTLAVCSCKSTPSEQ